MRPKVYLDSSVPSYLTARPNRDVFISAMRQWTQDWWENLRHKYDLYISDFVLLEIRRGDAAAALLRSNVLKDIAILEDTKTARRFARKLVRRLALPRAAVMDAYHIAIAIEGGMDILLTWNCTHIANPRHQPAIRELAQRRGFDVPVICTPRELLDGETDGA
ncbi:MAG: type II toxin-antitoxin system VapC family toxin [Planctomycetota bacterium]